MPINAHPEYIAAEKEYHLAQTLEDKIEKLKKMISVAPSHKGAENLRAQLKLRLKKFIIQQEKSKRKVSKKPGIKKEEMQAVIIGFTNTGKSSLLALLTNASPEIAPYGFTTKRPVVGMMNFQGTQVQIIEIPAFGSEYYDRGLVNSADVILILITELSQLEKMMPELNRAHGEKIIIFNNKKIQDDKNLRKIEATLQSKKHNFALISTKSGEEIEELKGKIFHGFGKIRVYTKEPGKTKSENPLILERRATIKEVAEKILRDSTKIKETRIWGPSSKFPGQNVGLHHELRDMDVVEFKTR